MEIFKKLDVDKRSLYADSYFSGEYNQLLYLKRSIDDGSNKPKFYISAFTPINGELKLQGYIYFYVDFEKRKSDFIGIGIEPEYRNLNIASLLLSNWIDLCLNNGIDYLDTHYKQKKPFLLYLLKTYGFEIDDLDLYKTSNYLITLYRDPDFVNKTKYLFFKSPMHEKKFIETKIYKSDNYDIVHNTASFLRLDDIILPLQNISRIKMTYGLKDVELAEEKVAKTLRSHQRSSN